MNVGNWRVEGGILRVLDAVWMLEVGGFSMNVGGRRVE